MDGGGGSFGRCFDKGAEQEIGKRVELGLHGDHMGVDDPGVGRIDCDLFMSDPSGQLFGK